MRQHATIVLLEWLLLATAINNGVVGWVAPHFQLRRTASGISDPRLPIRCRQQLPRSPPSRYTFSTTTTTSTTSLYGFFDFLNPYDSKIPPELAEEIYRAEANTEAAKDRGTRIFVYTLLAILGIALASFNGFLTEVRVNGLPDETTGVAAAVAAAASTAGGGNNLDVLVQAGFGWVLENPLYKFIFTNKIGGAMCMLLGGGSALLAEAEFDSKRLNAEKIYEELERRRTAKTKPGSTTATSQSKKKKRQSGKEKKSLRALSEVIDTSSSNEPPVVEAANDDETNAKETPTKDQNESAGGGGVFGKMKDLYEKADSMAASQALLLNKRLEDAGMVEKITDETGLKVIGRENAKQIQRGGQKKDKVDADDKKGDLEP